MSRLLLMIACLLGALTCTLSDDSRASAQCVEGAGCLRGTVGNVWVEPVPAATVVVKNHGVVVATIQTDEDGSFELRIPVEPNCSYSFEDTRFLAEIGEKDLIPYSAPGIGGPVREYPGPQSVLFAGIILRARSAHELPRQVKYPIGVRNPTPAAIECFHGSPLGTVLQAWGGPTTYGVSDILRSEAGESVFLRCAEDLNNGNNGAQWLFYYQPFPGAPTRLIGRCPYEKGLNSFNLIVGEGTLLRPLRPSCIMSLLHKVLDLNLDDNADTFLDETFWQYDCVLLQENNFRKLTTYRVAYPQNDGPPDPRGEPIATVALGSAYDYHPGGAYRAGGSASATPNVLGDGEPSITSQYSMADLNRDGVKTEVDQQLMSGALGSCAGQSGFVAAADINGDSCVDSADVEIFDGLFVENLPYEQGNHRPIAKVKNVTVTPGGCSASVLVDAINDGSFDPDGDDIALSLSSTGPFGLGTYAVWLTVTDEHGLADSVAAFVSVRDAAPPSILCPPSILLSGSAGCSSAFLPDIRAMVAVSDGCAPADGVFVWQNPRAGTEIANGSTVTITATDQSGNSGYCSVQVLIVPSGSPAVTCGSVTANAGPAACAAPVTFTPTATDSCGSSLQVTCIPASGSVFPVGTTSVTATAVDELGHVGTCTFTVTVRDVTAPSFVAPSRVEARSSPGESVAVVSYPVPSVTDACGVTGVSCSPPGGTAFLLGSTSVTCTASDAAANPSSVSFQVYVRNSGDCLGVGSQFGQRTHATTNGNGADQVTFAFEPNGPTGSYLDSVAGDWNGDGVDTVGVVYASSGAGGTTLANVYLRNSNSSGSGDLQFTVTLPANTGASYVPLSGDWDGDGLSTLAFYRPATGGFYIRNTNSSGSPDFSFVFGTANSTPLRGDWDGNGTDSVGVYVVSTFTFLGRNTNSAGTADLTLAFGVATATSTPVTGDWDGDGVDTLGFIGTLAGFTGNVHLHGANAVAPPVLNFYLSLGSGRMVSGNWDGNHLPYVRSVSPQTCVAGQSGVLFTFTGNDLGAVSSVAFLPTDGITVGSVTGGFGAVTALVSVAPIAPIGLRTVRLVSAGGDSNSVPIVVRAPGGIGETDTVGLVDVPSGSWLLRNSNSPGPASTTFYFSPYGPSLTPLRGDWNGDGIDTPGWFDPATNSFFLRNSNSAGPPDLTITFNVTTLSRLPVTGDWNGDGTDTVGLFETATGKFYLRSTNSPSSSQTSFVFRPVIGFVTVVPIIGDWDGSGTDTIGVYYATSGTFYLRNANSAGAANVQAQYGPSGTAFRPIVGDWNGDLTVTLGLYDPSTGAFFLKNSNSGGAADLVFTYGAASANYVPISGDWDALGQP